MSAKSKGMRPLNAVVWTQFLSSFADNLNFFIIVGMVNRQGFANPDAYVSYIQIAFLAAYVILAPIVGTFADKRAKSQVLLVGNLFKTAGILLLFTGLHPAVCYLVLGIGAVIYSPAKYGILTELTNTEDELLRANAKVEGTTILAILLGTVAGGLLAKESDLPGLIACLVVYSASIAMTFFVPARGGNRDVRYGASAVAFLRDVKVLFAHPAARFSLIGTGAFWLTASVLRIALIAWLPENLGITDTDQQSLIIGVCAIGVVFSAFVTPKLVPAGKLYSSYVYGFIMVTAVMVAAFSPNVWLTVVLMLIIGLFGGVFLIPLNTILQEVGKDLIGPGKTIAIQNFVENALNVSGLTVYLLLISAGTPINWSVVGMGTLLLLFVLYLATQVGLVKRAGTDDKARKAAAELKSGA